MKVQIKDTAGTSGTVTVQDHDVADVLKGDDWFGGELDTPMVDDVSVGQTIDELQHAIDTRSYEQYPLAQSLGLKLFSA